jgi:hypothetical protein
MLCLNIPHKSLQNLYLLLSLFLSVQLKYSEAGREKDCLPRIGQWNMMNKVIILHKTAVANALYLFIYYLKPYYSFLFFLIRNWSMVVESGAGCVLISLETCKTVLLLDSVVNLPACAKPQEWQASFPKMLQDILAHCKCNCLYLLVTTVTVLLSIIGLCFGACSSGYICAS